jgi:LPXTG-motif cell wall-anchored protein
MIRHYIKRKTIIIVFLISLQSITAHEHSCDILKDFKDDCGNKCGAINSDTKDTKCGDPDKRKFPLLLPQDPSEKNDDNTEYSESLELECVDKCPTNYLPYKDKNICAKNIQHFEKFEKDCSNDDAKESSNIWIYIVATLGVLVILVGLFLFWRKRNKDRRTNNI